LSKKTFRLFYQGHVKLILNVPKSTTHTSFGQIPILVEGHTVSCSDHDIEASVP